MCTLNFYSVTFTDSANKAITTRLIKEVQAQNPSFQASDIQHFHAIHIIHVPPHFTAATYTYYRSLSQEQSLKDRGVHEQQKKGRRHRERIWRVHTSASFIVYNYVL